MRSSASAVNGFVMHQIQTLKGKLLVELYLQVEMFPFRQSLVQSYLELMAFFSPKVSEHRGLNLTMMS